MSFLVGCNGQDKAEAGNPFLGGSRGLDISFLDGSPPSSVFDGGDFPFDIVVKLENVGEYFVDTGDVEVELSGFRPGEFSKGAGEMTLTNEEPLTAKRKESDGSIIPGNPVFMEFTGFNHRDNIVGASQVFPVKAGVCYDYGTIANAQLCSRKNVVNPSEGGVCRVNEAKTIYNSGAPVQVSGLTETARAKNKIGFTFKIVHSGSGEIFAPDTAEKCDPAVRTNKDKVELNIDTGLPGLSCTGLGEGTTEGTVTLYNGEKIVTCTQDLEGLDFEFPLLIELNYRYYDSIETQLEVKGSGE